jgi:hypothetical protein
LFNWSKQRKVSGLHSPERLDNDIERLQAPEEVGLLLTFGPMNTILNNAKELEELGFGAVVARVQEAAAQGLEALMTQPSQDSLQMLSHDAEAVLKLNRVVKIPPKLEEFLRKAVEEKKKPRLPEKEVKKPPQATQGKSGRGMSYDSVEARLRMNGLLPLAGGKKYSYWSLPGTSANDGTFIRFAAKSVRLVQRSKIGRKINDLGITEEAYYGKLTAEMVDRLISSSKRRSDPG